MCVCDYHYHLVRRLLALNMAAVNGVLSPPPPLDSTTTSASSAKRKRSDSNADIDAAPRDHAHDDAATPRESLALSHLSPAPSYEDLLEVMKR